MTDSTWLRTVPCFFGGSPLFCQYCRALYQLACHPYHYQPAPRCHHLAVNNNLSLPLANISAIFIIYSFYIYIIVTAVERGETIIKINNK